ncbi:Mucin-5B [Camelus dromedarius]|uniref:Mucin-5B n=1 Tax=Camelus dromedarius TaxID=9838 RepID=A0A5N4BY69_CAMDR|nr:Mucin-5B [Camelus dromedarius]
MGAPSGCQAPVWALVALLLVQKAAQRVTFLVPISVFPTMSSLNAAHSGRVCSTWGDSHYKTFDGHLFRFPGLCNYVFSAHCGAAYEDFNIQLRRGLVDSRPIITHIVLRMQGLVLEIANGSVLIDGRREELPYSRPGLLVEGSHADVKISVRLGLTFLWNGEDSALLELDPKYANKTCGLCGDFNGLPTVGEFHTHNTRLTPLQFGNLQKLDGPTEQCQDPLPSPADNCTDEEGLCRRTLLGPAFAQCNRLLDVELYVAACTQDLCRCPACPCATFAEYSRQCAHAGGQPQNWRGPDLCRTVLDDVTHTGCLPLQQCPCTHSGHTYAPGDSYTTSCSSCTCSGGLWKCQALPCPGTCSVQGGSHISTYDEKLYDMHGDCSYVLTKKCADNTLTVLAELRKCGLTDNENCLKTVTLSMHGGDTAIRIQANGAVFMNSIYTQLPVSAANVTIFRPSSFFILVQTGLGLQAQVQLVPLMQVFLRLDPSYHGQMCGLCGNFNQNQADDFRTISGVVEGTAAAFANAWKTQATCPNVKNSFEDPCSLSVENENYAQHWCSLLTSPAGAFSPCHAIVNPAPFHSNCMFDTCNCEKSEDCMCAALSSYVRACAAKGVLLSGWRDGVCTRYASNCPKSQNYSYVVESCQPTCRSLSQVDVTCDVAFVPVDGCTCPSGTFLDDAGACVPAKDCPCYSRGSVVAPGEVLHDNGVACLCTGGKLSCLGYEEQSTGCAAPMVFLDCRNASAGSPGAECLHSCHSLDVDCFSSHCVSGCVCPPGLVSDGSGGCVAQEDCPCLHNEVVYKPGETIRVDCNTCTCRSRRWECTRQPCLGTCVAYGDGHFITFDGERYSFQGSCEYSLAQDYCGGNGTANGTFRIITENVPCGTTGVTCSKAIKLFLENYELILHEGTYKVLQRAPGGHQPFKIRYMGLYLAIETRSGMILSWDRKTSVFIRLNQDYKGRVCGLCGNFDDNALNDLTTRSQSVVGDVLEFGNSWKFSPSCPDAQDPEDPCTANPHRKSWAQKQCSIISGDAFSACRSQVDSTRYYEACVSDACACDSGGDCECFCTAVAAYARACHEAGVCVSWRTPDICPLFCDYYNPHGECEWHYEPCGAPCLRTCRNPSGQCSMDLPGLEGCYPKCPPSKPFFNEDEMKCVAQCACYDEDGNHYDVGMRVPTAENCQSCPTPTPGSTACQPEMHLDGVAGHSIRCQEPGGDFETYANIGRPAGPSRAACGHRVSGRRCSRTQLEQLGQVVQCTLQEACLSARSHLTSGWTTAIRCQSLGGDFVDLSNIRAAGGAVCEQPVAIKCRAEMQPDVSLEQLPGVVQCTRKRACLPSSTAPSSHPGSTTPCRCSAYGQLFLPGDVIYNKTDAAGCHFSAICNQRCDVDRIPGACPTSSLPETAASAPPSSSPPGCDLAVPPRQVNESWILENCTVAWCLGHNRIVLLGPKPVAPITCVNGHLPVEVQSPEEPCDYHYECECSCSGWGNTHYETFDGTSYSFWDKCTYVLVREISPRHGNLSIHLHNRYCGVAASCPRALSVHYASMEVILTTATGADGQQESLGFKHSRVRAVLRGVRADGLVHNPMASWVQAFSKTGCCYSCEEVDSCQVQVGVMVLQHGGCITPAAVTVSFCEGFCPGGSRYSMRAPASQCQCTCCQETRTHQEVVTMQCPNGTAIQHTYTHVDECSCVPSCGTQDSTHTTV